MLREASRLSPYLDGIGAPRIRQKTVFVYDREFSDHTFVTLRVPRRAWQRWEARHGHYGEALHHLREICVTAMLEGSLRSYADRGDPFWRDPK